MPTNQSTPLPLDAFISEAELIALGNADAPAWQGQSEGQLAVDVFQTADEIIITAPMAGVGKDQIELHLHNDLLTIRGERISSLPFGAEPLYEECFWGKFSRTIVLPAEVKAELTRAEYRNGVLTVVLPKAKSDRAIPIFVVEE